MLNNKLSVWWDAIINSYSQLFFSDNKLFAFLLLLSSLTDPYVGLSGITSLLVALGFAHWLGFSPVIFRTGAYSYNSLLVGMVMGVYFQFSTAFFFVLIFISFFTFLLSVLLSNLLSRHNIPVLSVPFLFGMWILLLSVKSFGAIKLNDRGIYTINEVYSYGGIFLIRWYEWFNAIHIPSLMDVYLKSLGAIFFQYNLFAGVLILAGLIIYSRIAFVLSLIGFVTGYGFYYLLDGNFTQLQYSYIGFNFILTAIAVGGFFLIPSRKSFLLALFVTPVIALLLSSLSYLFAVFQLPIYSLPFNVAVIILLYVLNLRIYPKKLDRVVLQQFSPEKNLYRHLNRIERFRNDTYFHIHLPFFGERFVSQGYNGAITHKGDWQHALDFVVQDDEAKTYRPPGTDVSQYYCYDLPVIAPAAGHVITLVDGIDDNTIGGVDLEHNWGNAIVIKHSEYLFSKLTHLRKGSFKVRQGDYVHKGDILAACGNSGRSPEPHIHFQLQATPYIGSKTLPHPISYYVERKDGKFIFHSFEVPKEGESVQRIETTKLIKEAFTFTPGEEIRFIVTEEGKTETVKWEVFVDVYNQPYIYCHNTRATAYFVNNETVHYFTDFYGEKKSLLYLFYLGAHKQLLGFYPDMEIVDNLPVEGFYRGMIKVLQDFISPFYIFLKTEFHSVFVSMDDLLDPKKIEINSEATARTGNNINRKVNMQMLLQNGRIQTLVFREKNKTIVAECAD